MNTRVHNMLPILAVLAATATAPAAIAGDLWTVDVAGTGDFTDIQPAVDNAVDGDLILVLSGSYSRVIVANKALTIAAEDGNVVTSDSINVGPVRVHR
jgi:hypothetical protein